MSNEEEFSLDFPSELVNEGKIKVLVPNLKAYGVTPSDYAPSRAPVFYNPVMEFNRDLSVLTFQAYQRLVNKEITICEPLTSQGIRGIRYVAEIEGVKNVLLGDINQKAYQIAKYNIELNGFQEKIDLENIDANSLLCNNASSKKRFDIIDIDPFGSPVTYLSSAFMALRNNGLLAVTATDLAPLCGVHAKACLRKYGGKPLRTEYCHELAVRLMIGCLASLSAKHDIGIQVLFSHSSDHYIRVYVQIRYGAKKADESIKSLGFIMHCFKCMHREIVNQPFRKSECPECGTQMDYSGPLWIENIIDDKFLDRIIFENQDNRFKKTAKINKMVSLIKKEANMPPTYYVLDKLSGKLDLPAPATLTFITALQRKGFQAAQTHFNPRGIKTDAPALEMHKLLREMVK